VSQCQKSCSGLYDTKEDNRGRHADHPDGHHSIRLISDPPSSPIFMPDAIPAATLPLYPGLGQAQNMLACIPSGVVTNYCHQYAVIV